MRYVSRAQWGARAPRSRVSGTLSSPSTVHWNGPRMPDVAHERCASVVRGTQNFHMDGRGWSDIAYNFLVCRHGYVFEGRGLNVWNGANGTNAGNRSSHAVMVLAGTGNAFTVEAKRAVIDAIDHVAARTRAPAAPVIGHRDHKSTECPGDEIYAWVHAGLPVGPAPKEETKKPMFNPDTDLNALVTECYEKVVGRKPESDHVRGSWAWSLGVGQGGAYAGLMNALHYEARLREDNRMKALEAKVAGIKPAEAGVLTEQQILETVAKALLN